MRSAEQIKNLLLRLDGAAKSETVEFTSASGRRWEAELCLHVGTGPQSGRLKVIFRSLDDTGEPQRYTEPPAHVSKVPSEAVEQLGGEDLRELLATSVKV